MTEWMPIESAPRDHSSVLLCDRKGNMWVAVSYGTPEWLFGYTVTHWMPLPEPPKETP